jgi:hypothetical protein
MHTGGADALVTKKLFFILKERFESAHANRNKVFFTFFNHSVFGLNKDVYYEEPYLDGYRYLIGKYSDSCTSHYIDKNAVDKLEETERSMP